MSRFGLAIVAIDYYQQAERLPSTEAAARLRALLEPCGAQVIQAGAHAEADELRSFLYEWAIDKEGPADSFVYWIGHGAREGADAWLLASNSRSPLADPVAVNAAGLAQMLRMRWTERTEGVRAWTVLILDCCRGRDAATAILNALTRDAGGRPKRLAIVEVGGASATEVGRFIDALEATLGDYKENDKVIPLRSLLFGATDLLGEGVEPTIWLPGTASIPNPKAIPGVLTVGQDVVEEWRSAVAALPADVRSHFLFKAQGTEVSDLAWNFVGRRAESAELAAWLRNSESGLKVITGEPGAGKSALLGRFVMLADARIAHALDRAGLLTGPAAQDRPEVDAFQSVMLLTGKTLGQAQAALAAAGFTVTGGRARPAPGPHRVRTIVVDALDEAQTPELIAHDLLRPLSRQPGVRVVVATRRSLSEGPDLDVPLRSELLDALGVSTAETIFLGRDPDAMADFAQTRLSAGGVDPEVTDYVVQRVRNVTQPFLFVRLAIHELLARAGSIDVATVDQILGGSHSDIFGMALDRLRVEDRAVTDLLAALAYTQGRGLPLHDAVWTTVAAALWPGRRFAKADADRALVAAAPYVVLDGEHDQSVYRLAHKTFAERFLDADPDLAGSHLAIAERFLDGGPAWNVANPYALAHLPRHAASSGPVLDRVTADPHWLSAGAERFGVTGLLEILEGIGYAQRTVAVTCILGALRRARVALTRDPDQLAAQLHARLRDETEPAVVALVERLDDVAPPVWLRVVVGGGTWKASTDATMTFDGKVRALTSGRVQGRPVLAVAAADRVQWWDPLGGELHDFVDNDGERVTSLAMGVIDGRDVLVLGATYDGTVTVRPFDDGEPLARVTGTYFSHVGIGTLGRQTVILTSDGSDVQPFLLDGTRLPPLDPGGRVLAIGRHGPALAWLVEQPGGVMVRLWTDRFGHRDLPLPGARAGVTGSLVEFDGSSVAVVAQWNGIDAWDVITGNHLGHVDADPGFTVRTATALPVGTDIALAAGNDTDYEGGYVLLRSPGVERSRHRAHPALATAVAVAGDRMEALVIDPLRVIDLSSGAERAVSTDLAGRFGPTAPSTSEELRAIRAMDPSVEWPVSAWSLGSLDGRRVMAEASLGGACWVSAVDDGAMVAGPFGPGQRPGHPRTGRSRLRHAKGGPQPSTDVAFWSSGGGAFLACVHDGRISVYDVRSGTPLDVGGSAHDAVGSEATAVALGEHPMLGVVLARGAGGGAISLWTVPGGRRLCGISLDHGISRLWLDRDAGRLIALTVDSQLHVGDIVTQA